ncbi:MAG: hypothetical protein R3324_08315 [Halobacteriales archaeon]|nr:hypothetical protein [Halobacteriales archaeon]
MTDERGVTEVLGYVLVFALVTTTLGVIYAGGITGLYDMQDAEQIENMVRAYDVLADNLQDIHRRGATSRATEVKLAGGTIGFGDQVRVVVDVRNSSDPNDNRSFTMNPQPITYTHPDGSEVVYVAGGVIRSDGPNSVMRADPELRQDADRAMIPFIQTYQTRGTRSIGGTSTVLVVARLYRSALAGEPDTGFGDFDTGPASDAVVNVTVESPRAGAWGSYFERRGFTAIDAYASDGDVTYQFTTNRLFVPLTEIELTLRQ